jgi:hypothetical protein
MIDSAHEFSFRAKKEETITGDVGLIKQAARILMDNAVQYTPEGGRILLEVGAEAASPAFSVTDEGIGIKAEDVPKIFDRSLRSDPARARKSGGAGWALHRQVDRGQPRRLLPGPLREGIGTRDARRAAAAARGRPRNRAGRSAPRLAFSVPAQKGARAGCAGALLCRNPIAPAFSGGSALDPTQSP